MAARFLISLCSLVIIHHLLPVLQTSNSNGRNTKDLYILKSSNGEHNIFNALQSTPNFPPNSARDSRTALKRVQVSLVFRFSEAVTKHSKHGMTVLALPSCLLCTDLTIHMDIQRIRVRKGQETLLEATRVMARRICNPIKYLRSELIHSRLRRAILDDIFRKIKNMDILRTRRIRSVHAVRNCHPVRKPKCYFSKDECYRSESASGDVRTLIALHYGRKTKKRVIYILSRSSNKRGM